MSSTFSRSPSLEDATWPLIELVWRHLAPRRDILLGSSSAGNNSGSAGSNNARTSNSSGSSSVAHQLHSTFQQLEGVVRGHGNAKGTSVWTRNQRARLEQWTRELRRMHGIRVLDEDALDGVGDAGHAVEDHEHYIVDGRALKVSSPGRDTHTTKSSHQSMSLAASPTIISTESPTSTRRTTTSSTNTTSSSPLSGTPGATSTFTTLIPLSGAPGTTSTCLSSSDPDHIPESESNSNMSQKIQVGSSPSSSSTSMEVVSPLSSSTYATTERALIKPSKHLPAATSTTSSRQHRLHQAVQSRTKDVTLVLENVQNSANVSMILRTADAFGLQEVWTVNTEPTCRTDVSKKLSSRNLSRGAEKYVDLRHFRNLHEFYREVKKMNREEEDGSTTTRKEWTRSNEQQARAIGKDEGAEIWVTTCLPPDIEQKDYRCAAQENGNIKSLIQPASVSTKPQRIFLVLGSESRGVSPEMLALADRCVHYPLNGACESLNVAVAAGVLLADIFAPGGGNLKIQDVSSSFLQQATASRRPLSADRKRELAIQWGLEDLPVQRLDEELLREGSSPNIAIVRSTHPCSNGL
ncbi:unnamed protein product [Amoebophrya sp. A25]|nr:unnamed protein product [Amoebophrya sp. A25]|eukprot:GSA25T00012844001.1